MSARGPRYEARMNGERVYYTEAPCARGHVAERETRSGRCLACRREDDRRTYVLKIDRVREKTARYNSANRELVRVKAAERRANMTKEELARTREIAKLKSREWRKNNPAHRTALSSKYLADKHKRTPKWANHRRIVEIYKRCPPGWHVDHIYPLRGREVSGLHVEHNLQYLPPVLNMRKNRKMVTPPEAYVGLGWLANAGLFAERTGTDRQPGPVPDSVMPA